jgi:hypothetical protein
MTNKLRPALAPVCFRKLKWGAERALPPRYKF